MSRLKNPTPCRFVRATCSAIRKVRLIGLTEDGVTTIARSAPCNPSLRVSSSCRPVEMPLIFFPYAWGATPASGSGGDTACRLDGSFLGLVVTFLLHRIHPRRDDIKAEAANHPHICSTP